MSTSEQVVDLDRRPSPGSEQRGIGGLLRFGDGDESVVGELVQGGSLVVEYDPARLPGCQTRHGGMPAWDLLASVAFGPSGQSATGDLVEHLGAGPTGPRVLDPPRPVPFVARVPLDAEWAELWFATRSATEACVAWDSRYGQNYRYPVTRSGPTPQVVPHAGATRRAWKWSTSWPAAR